MLAITSFTFVEFLTFKRIFVNSSLISGIKDKCPLSVKTFKKDLLNGKINPSEVAFMSPSQMHPQKWQYWIKKKEYMEWRENNIAYSDAYQCGKCKERKCKVTQLQTRSADEGATIYVSCMVCHHTFKICS